VTDKGEEYAEGKLNELLADAKLRQLETRGGAPREVPTGHESLTSLTGLDDEPKKSWPMMIYILPNGDVITRRELTVEIGSPHLAARCAVVLRVLPETLPGNSNGGSQLKIEVLKFRGDAAEFVKSLTLGFYATPGNEDDLIRKMFPDQERHKGAAENFLGHFGDDETSTPKQRLGCEDVNEENKNWPVHPDCADPNGTCGCGHG